MEYYINFKGEKIFIKELDNTKLVLLYKYFLGYCKVLKKTAKNNGIKSLWYSIFFGVKENRNFIEYLNNMNYIKNALYKEIKKRKIVMGKITVL